MSLTLSQLYVKTVVVGALVGVDQSFIRPFQIPTGKLQALFLKAIHVRFHSDSNQNARVQWALIQKNELFGDFVIVGPLAENQDTPASVSDNDLLVCGEFEIVVSTAGVNIQERTKVKDYIINFPEPICVPRSPTLVVHNHSEGSGAITATLIATLFYQKKVVGLDFVTGLLKQFIGRRQDMESNIPRVIDE